MSRKLDWSQTYFAVLVTAILLAILACVPAHSQLPPPVPQFTQPPQQQVYMVRAWTPVRNFLGWGPLYRPYVQIAPAYQATVTPVAPLGGVQ